MAQADWDDHEEARAQAADADRAAFVPDDEELYAEDVREEYRRDRVADTTTEDEAA